MYFSEVSMRAFEDEMEKIAFGGFIRSGIRPIRAETLLGRSGKFVKRKFIKTSGLQTKALLTAGATGFGLGVYGKKKFDKAVDDYQTGKALRAAQRGG